MKDPYQFERNKAREKSYPGAVERAPLDFSTEEERHHREVEAERHRSAELERVREARRQKLADVAAAERAEKQALIHRHEKWLRAWHIGLLISGITALVAIVLR